MSKFKVGEKIVFYDVGKRRLGEVREISKKGLVLVWPFDASAFLLERVHPKQCRKLKPRKKPDVLEFVCEWKRGTSGFIYPYECDLAALESLQGKRTRVHVEVLE